MRIKAPFVIATPCKTNKRLIQFLQDSAGRYLGQFNSHKGKPNGTFTTFLRQPTKHNGRFTVWYDETGAAHISEHGAMRMLERAFSHLYGRNKKHEDEMPANTEAMFTLSGALVQLEQTIN